METAPKHESVLEKSAPARGGVGFDDEDGHRLPLARLGLGQRIDLSCQRSVIRVGQLG